MIPRLQEKYKGEIRKKLESLDKYSNVNQIPKIEKVIVHMGVSPQLGKDVLEEAIKNLTIITGRKPALNKAKVSVANFKLRQGMSTGCRVTTQKNGKHGGMGTSRAQDIHLENSNRGNPRILPCSSGKVGIVQGYEHKD